MSPEILIALCLYIAVAASIVALLIKTEPIDGQPAVIGLYVYVALTWPVIVVMLALTAICVIVRRLAGRAAKARP